MKVILIGNPNAGKTSLFNSMAKTRYKVANYPGVTVEKKMAKVQWKGQSFELFDLPGIYSLSPYSEEERVARDVLTSGDIDLIVQVVDASNLERNLYLSVQLLELNIPVIIALNMLDVAKQRDIEIHSQLLSQNLSLPVIEVSGRNARGIDLLQDTITNFNFTGAKKNIFSYGEDIDLQLQKMSDEITLTQGWEASRIPPRFIALKYLENDKDLMIYTEKKFPQLHLRLSEMADHLKAHLHEVHKTTPEAIISDHRYGAVSSLTKGVIKRELNSIDRVFLSDKIDTLLTHRYLGPFIMLGILYVAYQFTFWASEYPVALLENTFSWLGGFFNDLLPDGLLKSLIVSGIIDSVGGVLGFTPLILFMFMVVSFLEDSGYMARVAFNLDRVFKTFGLQGSSALPYIVSGGIAGGCAVPGVMAARTIRGKKEKLLTILTAPFMVCGAKLPVYALLIAVFFPQNKGVLLLLVTVLSWAAALLMSKLLGKTILRGENESSFIMELPPYKMPTFKGGLIHAWERTYMYIKKAFTIILAVSIVVWALMTFPRPTESYVQTYQQQREGIQKDVTLTSELKEQKLNEIENHFSQENLKKSFAGRLGVALEPLTLWAGFDWKTNIALLAGIPAKEIIVSTLATAYSLGEVDPEDGGGLIDRLRSDPRWTPALGLALIIFVMMYSPCLVTIVVMNKETQTLKWGMFSLFGYTFLAFGLAVMAYQIF